MKKLIALLLAASFGISLVACSSAPEAKKDETPAAAAADANKDEAATDAPKKSLKKNEGNRMERAEDDEE